MSKFATPLERNQNKMYKKSSERGTYTSYNSLAGKIEVPSVSEAMRDFIKNEFNKLKEKGNIS